jgi:hypothetical protein
MTEAIQTEKHYLQHYCPIPSPIAMAAFDLLSRLWHGGHHVVERVVMKSAVWNHPLYCLVRFRGELATFDFTDLTYLVFLAHDLCIRVSVSARSTGLLELKFHPRQREGRMGQRHPTLDDVFDKWRNC